MIREDELQPSGNLWGVVFLICGSLALLILIDGAYLLRINAQLREAAQQALDANQAKTRFLSAMSHDIRTPMNAVLGMISIARQNVDDPEYMLQCLEKSARAGRQLLTLKIAAELTQNDVFSRLSSDPKLLDSAKAGGDEAVQALIPAFDFLGTVWESGYTDPAVNDTLPKENYDTSILRFFEGDVPFWVSDTEKVSGMKKRESKSEAFQAAPFTYSFIYTPLGQDGSNVYQSPWFGFAANVDGNHPDYAVEFLRFLAQKDEINKIAAIKGVPSVAKDPTIPAIYQDILAPEAVKKRAVNTGAITPRMEDAWYDVTAAFVAGEYDSSESAVKAFLESVQ